MIAQLYSKPIAAIPIDLSQERIKERERVTSVCYSTGKIQNRYYK